MVASEWEGRVRLLAFALPSFPHGPVVGFRVSFSVARYTHSYSVIVSDRPAGPAADTAQEAIVAQVRYTRAPCWPRPAGRPPGRAGDFGRAPGQLGADRGGSIGWDNRRSSRIALQGALELLDSGVQVVLGAPYI
jgi:hypothetical protein